MSFATVAVTGGSGRLGKYVVHELRSHYEVKVLDLEAPGDGTAFQKTDVLKPGELKTALAGQDAVVHLAGLDLDQAASPDAFLHVNAVGTWNVLEAAYDAGVSRVIQCSSITATGLNEAREDFSPLYLPVNEDHPTRPVDPYGVSKRLQEEIARSFNHRDGFDVVSLRLMLVMFETNRALVQDRLKDPANRWLYYYVSPADAARAFHCALEAHELPYDTMFITAQDTCRGEATLEWLAAEFGNLPDIRDPALYERNPRASIFDGSRARKALNFVPQDSWHETAL